MSGNDDKKGKVDNYDKRKKPLKAVKKNKSDKRNLTLRRKKIETINFTGRKHFNLGDCRQCLCPDLRCSAFMCRTGIYADFYQLLRRQRDLNVPLTRLNITALRKVK